MHAIMLILFYFSLLLLDFIIIRAKMLKIRSGDPIYLFHFTPYRSSASRATSNSADGSLKMTRCMYGMVWYGLNFK